MAYYGGWNFLGVPEFEMSRIIAEERRRNAYMTDVLKRNCTPETTNSYRRPLLTDRSRSKEEEDQRRQDRDRDSVYEYDHRAQSPSKHRVYDRERDRDSGRTDHRGPSGRRERSSDRDSNNRDRKRRDSDDRRHERSKSRETDRTNSRRSNRSRSRDSRDRSAVSGNSNNSVDDGYSRAHSSSRKDRRRSRSRERQRDQRSRERGRSRYDDYSSDSNSASHDARGSRSRKALPWVPPPLPPVQNQFRNDGSFLEMFRQQMQVLKEANEQIATDMPQASAVLDTVSPSASNSSANPTTSTVLPIIAKRRAKPLKVGMVAKRKIEEATEEKEDKDGSGWSRYMQEVARYRANKCIEDETAHPLMK